MSDALETLTFAAGGVRVGRLVRIGPDGIPYVELERGVGAPIAARTIAPLEWRDGGEPVDVLLALERGDPARPIVLGVLRDRVELSVAPARREFVVEGRRMEFQATDSLVLRCGRGSIELRADGEIVVRGTRLTQRSSGPNVIQGATVRIN